MTESRSKEAANPEPSQRAETLADRTLLEGVVRREPDALSRFFDAAFPYVFSLAHRMTGERPGAEDITQDVFLKVFRAADRLHTDRDARPWLTRITMNACRDALRRRAVRHTTTKEVTSLASVVSPDSSPSEHAQQQEQEQQLQQALASLDADHRSVILLRDYSGCTHEQIASVLGIRQDAVRKRYSRALDRLRAWMEGP